MAIPRYARVVMRCHLPQALLGEHRKSSCRSLTGIGLACVCPASRISMSMPDTLRMIEPHGTKFPIDSCAAQYAGWQPYRLCAWTASGSHAPDAVRELWMNLSWEGKWINCTVENYCCAKLVSSDQPAFWASKCGTTQSLLLSLDGRSSKGTMFSDLRTA